MIELLVLVLLVALIRLAWSAGTKMAGDAAAARPTPTQADRVATQGTSATVVAVLLFATGMLIIAGMWGASL